MLRYNTKTRPGLVALYDIRPGNGAGPFLQPRSLHGAHRKDIVTGRMPYCRPQEGHPTCKKIGCWFVGGDDLTGAIAPAVTTATIILAAIKPRRVAFWCQLTVKPVLFTCPLFCDLENLAKITGR